LYVTWCAILFKAVKEVLYLPLYGAYDPTFGVALVPAFAFEYGKLVKEVG
jgi:hypothetical protein